MNIGGILSGIESQVVVVDVTPLTLGIETTGLSGPIASLPPY
jgi:molecular chaperone DnaK (HSP70)